MNWVWKLVPDECYVCGGRIEKKPVKIGNISLGGHPECFLGYWRRKKQVPVLKVERKFGGVPLKTAGMECLRSRYSLNITDGCAHECVYCYARAMPSSPPHGVFFLRRGIFERVRRFVQNARIVKPVYMSPVSDPLATRELAELTVKLAEFFVDEGVPFYLVTKGEVPLRMLRVVEGFPFFALQVSLNTLDEEVSRLLEPNAPPPHLRIKSIMRAKDHGVFTVLREDPHMPFLTDGSEQIKELTCLALDLEGDHIVGSFVGIRASSLSHKEYLYFWFRENGLDWLIKKYEKLFARGSVISGYHVVEWKYRFEKLKQIRDLISRSGTKTTYGLCMEGMRDLWIGDKCEGFRFPPVKKRDGNFIPVESCGGECKVCATPCTPKQVKLSWSGEE
ncbi:MAG: radical SAM protein [Candidatus Jordarchaeales archaeon]